PTAVELRDLLPRESRVPSTGQPIGEHLAGLVDECRPGSCRPTVLAGVPIGQVEGLLLPHLETRQRFTEACRAPEVTEEVGQPTAGGNGEAKPFEGRRTRRRDQA